MAKKLNSILDNFGLDYPRVYRFIGYHPIKINVICPLYVGISGDSKNVWDFIRSKKENSRKNAPQMLKGRILRYLNDDAGILGMIIDDIKLLKSIEYRVVDPNNFENLDNFRKAIRYLEYYIRVGIGEKTYYDEIINVSVKLVEADETMKNIVKNLFLNNKVTIDIPDLSGIEKEFLNYYSVITSIPIKKLINFRRYKTVKDVMNKFLESWDAIKKENYF